MVDDEFGDGPGPKVDNGEEKACPDGVYDPWHRGKQSTFQRLFSRSETPFLILGVALILLISIFFFFVPRSGDDEAGRKLSLLEKRLGPLEDKLGRLEEKFAKISIPGDSTGRTDKQAAACERAIDRFESVEASLTMRIERMAQDLERFKSDVVHAEKKPASPSKVSTADTAHANKKANAGPKAVSAAPVHADKKPDVPPKAPSTAVTVQGKPTYHEVRAGETLFRISKQYNLTVDALRRLNKLAENSAIATGQKLIVSETSEKSR